MRRIKVELQGYDESMRRAKNFEDAIPLILAKAMHLEASRILNRSQELVPRATGRLAASAFIKKPVFYGSMAISEIGYNEDGQTPYAVKIHETRRAGQTQGLDPQGRPYNRPWATTGEWKFLERARDEHVPTSAERVLNDTRRALLLAAQSF